MPETKNKFKIGAIIQARTGSTRLPGKVLMNIGNKPMLWHIIERLKYSKKISEIILAIPDNKQNDILEKFAKQNGIKYYRGSEENVLSRYYETAKKFKCDIVVRITSDCPLIDPFVVDNIINKQIEKKFDYTSNTIKRTFPKGLDTEVFGFKILEMAFNQAEGKYEKEHVTPYIYEHPEFFRLQSVEAEEIIRHPEFRLTVDVKNDLELIREIYKVLYHPFKIFCTEEIINLFNRKPELLKLM
jgi:spore coat polysaccharide biosynthesis protein SpsF (cytidylyltransferase family)